MSPSMRAFATTTLSFSSFLPLGYGAERLIDLWMERHGAGLDEVQAQAGDNGRKGGSFLLGVWHK